MIDDHIPIAEIANATGRAPILLVCEHASNRFPEAFGTLGLSADARQSHIAWDPGALGVALRVAEHLDAPLVHATVSRLVYDCNRPPEAADAVPSRSENSDIPGNAGLSTDERDQRVRKVYTPFHAALGAAISRYDPQAIITIHSFTPRWFGALRSTEIGVLHDRDRRLADALLEQAGSFADHRVMRNDPYGPQDGVTHTLREHAVKRGLLNAMMEIRNDLIPDQGTQAAIGTMLAGWISQGFDKARGEMAAQIPHAGSAQEV
ncbi:MAG: N-formylglutamate amidohydrolase [Paracoccaceae bacterium]